MTYLRGYETVRLVPDRSPRAGTQVKRPDHRLPAGIAHAVREGDDVAVCGRRVLPETIGAAGWPAPGGCPDCLAITEA